MTLSNRGEKRKRGIFFERAGSLFPKLVSKFPLKTPENANSLSSVTRSSGSGPAQTGSWDAQPTSRKKHVGSESAWMCMFVLLTGAHVCPTAHTYCCLPGPITYARGGVYSAHDCSTHPRCSSLCARGSEWHCYCRLYAAWTGGRTRLGRVNGFRYSQQNFRCCTILLFVESVFFSL